MDLHHLAFRTFDLERLCDFYEQVVGLARVREQPGYSVWLALGEAVLMIEQADSAEPNISAGSRELVALCIDEDGRAGLKTRLADRGLSVEDETEHTTYFRDPDGRRVAVSTYPLAPAR